MDGFFDKPMPKTEVNEELQAWRSKDWDKLDEILSKTKTKETDTFFDVMNSINFDKRELDIESYCPRYSSYMVNMGLSQHADTIPAVIHANIYLTNARPQLHYDFYKGILEKRKRFGKWPKQIENTENKFIYSVIMKSHEVGLQTAIRYRAIMESGDLLNKFIAERLFYLEDSDFMKTICKNKSELGKFKKEISAKYNF